MLAQTPGDQSINIAFSPDERLVAQFGRGDGMIHVYETATGKLRHNLGRKLELDDGPGFDFFGYEVAFSSDGKFLASWSSMDNFIRLWDLATGLELNHIARGGSRPPTIHLDSTGNAGSISPGLPMAAFSPWAIPRFASGKLATLRVRRELLRPSGCYDPNPGL